MQKISDKVGKLIVFIEVKGKCVCLICYDTVAVMSEEYNVRRHYETKHPGAERAEKAKEMAASLRTQQQYFFRDTSNKIQEYATIASSTYRNLF